MVPEDFACPRKVGVVPVAHLSLLDCELLGEAAQQLYEHHVIVQFKICPQKLGLDGCKISDEGIYVVSRSVPVKGLEAPFQFHSCVQIIPNIHGLNSIP